jgi:hypothetical protein
VYEAGDVKSGAEQAVAHLERLDSKCRRAIGYAE